MTAQHTQKRIFSDVDSGASDQQAAALNILDALAALPAIQRIRHIARTALDVQPGQRLLDAGCGAGEEARELSRLVGPDGEITAIDLSAALIATAKQRDDAMSNSGVRYAVGDIAKLDFPDGAFDGVRSERVIQHLADPDAAVAELVRVVRPGGRVCLIDTDWESFLLDGMPQDLVVEMQALGRKLRIRPAGRLLRGRLIRAGVREVTAEPVTITLTDRLTAETIHPTFNPYFVRSTGMVPGELGEPWLTAFDAALERGDFLGVLTIWVVSGVKN
jgi:ubiquinone/menaquinone biosynthesis C-methylase UbiE